MLLGRALDERWKLPLTEAHPKALGYLLRRSGDPQQADMVQGLIAGLDDLASVIRPYDIFVSHLRNLLLS